MKKQISFPVLFLVIFFFLFAVFLAWFIPSMSSVRFRITETRQDLETSEGRERKQQEEYNKAVEELPVIQQELSEKEPIALEAEQKVSELKALRKKLKAEKKSLEEAKNPDMEKEVDKSRNIFQYILLSFAAFLAAVLLFSFYTQYHNACSELSVLKSDLAASTAVWKQINEDKLIVQRELKVAKNNLREADLTIEESSVKILELEEDIARLEQEIEALKSGNP